MKGDDRRDDQKTYIRVNEKQVLLLFQNAAFS